MLRRRMANLVVALLILLGPLFAVTRVSFTHPGHMMKIPTTFIARSPYLFASGFTTEVHNFSPFNTAQGVFFSMDVSDRFTIGFSSGQGADTTATEKLLESTYIPAVEFGFHTQYKVFVRQDMSFSIGLHDIIFENDASEGLRLDPKQLSFFGVIGSEKGFGEYRLSTYMGFGTGGFSAVRTPAATSTTATTTTTDTTTEQGMGAGVFAGVLLKTPYMPKWGGIDFVGEFDGSGLNVGLRIPLTSDYRLGLGFTHIENLPAFSNKYSADHPGFIMNFTMTIPKGLPGVPGVPGAPSPLPDRAIPGAAIIDSTLLAADDAVTVLRDSLRLSRHQIRNLATQVSLLQQKSVALADSVKTLNLEKNVSQKNINRAMRHLSRSLRYFHSGDYREALQEVETALDLNPNLALAYARRGSIYYQLGDPQRATINWNLALQMDPEYDDVRNILKALHENRLKTTSFSRD